MTCRLAPRPKRSHLMPGWAKGANVAGPLPSPLGAPRRRGGANAWRCDADAQGHAAMVVPEVEGRFQRSGDRLGQGAQAPSTMGAQAHQPNSSPKNRPNLHPVGAPARRAGGQLDAERATPAPVVPWF